MDILLKDFLSMEDGLSAGIDLEIQQTSEPREPEPEVDVVETPPIPVQAEAEVPVAQVIEDLDERRFALEHFREILQHGLETQQYSPQFAAITHVTLEAYNALFDIEIPLVSLEHYGHDTLDEFYQLALEDFTQKLTRLEAVRTRLQTPVIETE